MVDLLELCNTDRLLQALKENNFVFENFIMDTSCS